MNKAEEYQGGDRGGSESMTDLNSDVSLKAEKESSASTLPPKAWSSNTPESTFYIHHNNNENENSLNFGIGDGDKASFPKLPGTSSTACFSGSIERTKNQNESSSDVEDGKFSSTSVSQTGKKYIITKRNLIVNYLPQTYTDRQLFNLFVSYGPIDSVKIMRDATTGYSYGFGFVNFVNEDDGIRARSQMNGAQVDNKRIKVSFARPPSDDIKDTNLYVTNLPRSMTEEDLFSLFAPFGEIVQRKLLIDRYTNLPRGVAFIRFERRDQAAAAINALNNYIPQGAEEPIRIRLAEDHGKQKAAYLAGFRAGMGLPSGPPGGQSKTMTSRQTTWNAYPGKRSMDAAWNYERRNRAPSCNPIMDGYWTGEAAPPPLHSEHFVFGGGHHDSYPYCEPTTDYAHLRKRTRYR